MTGHIFSFDGDIQDVVCDAWLLPVDEIFNFTASWNRTTWDLPEENFDFEPWGPDEYARDWVHHAGTNIWLGKVGGWGLDATHYAHCVLEFLPLMQPIVLMRGLDFMAIWNYQEI